MVVGHKTAQAMTDDREKCLTAGAGNTSRSPLMWMFCWKDSRM